MDLDEQRQASMADEGGASGAAMEGEEREDRAAGREILDGSRLADAIVIGAAFVLGALTALTVAAVWRGGD